MSTDHRQPTETADGQEKKERYESLLRTIECQTGGPNQTSSQASLVPQSSILVCTAAHGQWDVNNIRRALHTAVENGDVLRVRREDVRLSLTTEQALRAVIAEQNMSGSPDMKLIEHAASLL